MAAESFDDHGCGIPAQWVQPVRQQAHRVAALEAQKAPHPDYDPDSFGNAPDLA